MLCDTHVILLSVEYCAIVQGGPEGLDAEKLLGGNEPLKEEEDMWFRQQNRPVTHMLHICL